MHTQLKLFLVFIAAAVLSLLLYFQIVQEQVDVLYVNATIHTMDDANSVAHAIAVRGDRIAGVGERGELEKQFRSTSVVDLEGKPVFPGFIDAHAHFVSLGFARLTVDLIGAASEREAADRVRLRLQQIQNPGTWIRGHGWDQNDWATKQFPTRAALDRVAPSHPVYLTRIDGHAIWVNSRALEIAGVTAQTADPPGGKIHRDAGGNPTGVFVDAAMQLVTAHLPPPSDDEILEAAAIAGRECVQYGLTSIHDMGVTDKEIALFRRLIDQRQLPVRLYAAIDGVGETWKNFLQSGTLIGYGDNRLSVRAIKLYIDGALGSRGAALIEPYSDDPANRGLTLSTEDELRSATDEALAHGFQVCIHAIGDRGNNIVLNIYEAALKAQPQSDARLRVEHAQVLHPSDIPRFKQLGALPSMQPTHCTSDMYWAEARLGAQRIKGAYAWRSLLETGVVIPGGSDFPVEHPNPLYGISSASTRKDHDGRPQNASDVRKYFQLSREGLIDRTQFENGWYASQAMSREEAIRSFTTWAAYSAFEENLKGSLEAGKLADFVVLSADLLQIPEAEILKTVVERTVVGGKEVYRRATSVARSQE